MNAEKKKRTNDLKVKFGTVQVREYQMTLGDNPSVSIGPPVCLSNDYSVIVGSGGGNDDDTNGIISIDEFETQRLGKRRKPQSHKMKLNYYQRYEILHHAGFDDKQIQQGERGVSWIKFKRNTSYYYCFPYIYVGRVKTQLGRRKTKKFLVQENKKRAKKT